MIVKHYVREYLMTTMSSDRRRQLLQPGYRSLLRIDLENAIPCGSNEECGLRTSLHALASSLPASILATASDMADHICNKIASYVSMKKYSDL